MEALSKEELEAAHCWEPDDRVPRRPEMTEFRRRLRYALLGAIAMPVGADRVILVAARP